MPRHKADQPNPSEEPVAVNEVAETEGEVIMTTAELRMLKVQAAQFQAILKERDELKAQAERDAADERERDKLLDQILLFYTKPSAQINIGLKTIEREDKRGRLKRQRVARNKIFFKRFLSVGVGIGKDPDLKGRVLTEQDLQDSKLHSMWGASMRTLRDLKNLKSEDVNTFQMIVNMMIERSKIGKLDPVISYPEVDAWLEGRFDFVGELQAKG